MLPAVYHASLIIICITALWLALDPHIPSGIVGTFCIGGVAMFSVAAADGGNPPNWLVGQTASLAGACVWGATRVAWHRRAQRRRTLTGGGCTHEPV